MTASSPVYQIDCQMTRKGKVFAGSKKRVCWHFGFASQEALQNGRSGTDCRGAEHQIVFVWSLASGKQLVLVDGHEVHWSKTSLSRKLVFECEWTMASTGSKAKVIAHASQPLVKKEGFRQFDLIIDGVSFWDMPKMYELGSGNSSSNNAPPTPARVSPTPPTTTTSLRQVAPTTPDMDDYSVVSDVHTVHSMMYSSQPQLGCFDDIPSRPISPSPSMPDLLDLHNPFSSANSVMMTPPPYQQQPNSLKRAMTPSPTSVTVSINPFDMYASPSPQYGKQHSPYPYPHQYAAPATMALQQQQSLQGSNPFLQYPYQQGLPQQQQSPQPQSPYMEQRTVCAGY